MSAAKTVKLSPPRDAVRKRAFGWGDLSWWIGYLVVGAVLHAVARDAGLAAWLGSQKNGALFELGLVLLCLAWLPMARHGLRAWRE
jgi:hypothetical protein